MRGELKRAGNRAHRIKIRGTSDTETQIPKVKARISFAVVLELRNGADVVEEGRDEGVVLIYGWVVCCDGEDVMWHKLPIETPSPRYGCLVP